MNGTDVRATILEYVRDAAGLPTIMDTADLDPTVPLEDLGVDELGHIELIMDIESNLGCEITDDAMDSMVTINALVDHVNDLRK